MTRQSVTQCHPLILVNKLCFSRQPVLGLGERVLGLGECDLGLGERVIERVPVGLTAEVQASPQ